MRLLLGLDIGTTAMKTALYDEKGNLTKTEIYKNDIKQ